MRIAIQVLRVARFGGLIAAAFVVAGGLNDYLRAELFVVPMPPAETTGSVATAPTGGEEAAVQLSERHVFGPGLPRDVAPPPSTGGPEVAQSPSAPVEAEIVPLALALVGTAVAEAPEDSLATVRSRTGTSLVRVGDSVLEGAATVASITPGALYLQVGERRERIKLGAPLPEEPRPTRFSRHQTPSRETTTQHASGPRASGPRPGRPPRPERGIRATGNSSYEVDRAWLQKQARSMGSKDLPQVIPTRVGGQPRLKLGAVPRSGLFGQLGLRSGDVLESVNGQPARDAGKLLQMADALQQARRLEVQVRRRGLVRTLRYSMK